MGEDYEQFRCDNCGTPNSATYGNGVDWKLCGTCYMNKTVRPELLCDVHDRTHYLKDCPLL